MTDTEIYEKIDNNIQSLQLTVKSLQLKAENINKLNNNKSIFESTIKTLKYNPTILITTTSSGLTFNDGDVGYNIFKDFVLASLQDKIIDIEMLIGEYDD